jgi:osmotically inducible protein OsmC
MRPTTQTTIEALPAMTTDPATQGTLLYTAKTRTIGGRDGRSRSTDGRLDLLLARPGAPGTGTNPEQLVAAGWSASLATAMAQAALRQHVALPADAAIDAEVDLCVAGGEYFLAVRFNVGLPGLARDVARALIDEAHATCPYAKAIRGNIDVTFNLA